MYQPAHHREDRLPVLHGLIVRQPLGLLILRTPDGLSADPIPFVLDSARGTHGTLLAHVARANPLWRAHDETLGALVVFQGPQAYVTPSWYATKRETGKVVPTWNYILVQAAGQMIVHDDARWVSGQIERLTRQLEEPRAAPWAVSDAPEDFTKTMMRAIVGIEIPIASLEGKWKISQNRNEADRAGVAAGLRQDRASEAMAQAVETRGL